MRLQKMLLVVGTVNSLMFSSCKGDLAPVALPKYTFYLQNNSQDTLTYSYSTLFPDTSTQNNRDSSLIYPGRQNEIDIPAYLLPNFKTNGVVEIFLINADTLQKYSWQTVMSKYLIAKRYDLTYDSIKKNNNIITYP